MEKKPLTIRDVSIENITKFHDQRGPLGLTPAGYFDKILNQINTPTPQTVNKTDTTQLHTHINDLQEDIDRLNAINLDLQNKETNLNTKLSEVNGQLTELINNPATITKEIAIKLTGTQYIVEPPPEIAKIMQRAIAYDRKAGKLQNITPDQYLQLFTVRAISYLIKNEYSI